MIWCLPGFLGQSSHWDFFEAPIRAAGLSLKKWDLFKKDQEPSELDLVSWGKYFANHVAKRDPNPVLMGYSLGGRLALHAFLAQPKIWKNLVIVSANTGLLDPKAREKRRQHDENWARRFESEPWSEVIADWQKQPVFGGVTSQFNRTESEYNRKSLATALRKWSTGAQENLLESLVQNSRQVHCPILWIAGSEDDKYVEMVRQASNQVCNSSMWIAPNCHHRVPWESQESFTKKVIDFL